MSPNTPSQKNHPDVQASAFIKRIQQNTSEPIIGPPCMDDFKNLPPAEMKRLLDVFVSEHGDLEFWSLQDIVETFAADSKEADAELRMLHSADNAALHRHYADLDADADISASYHHYHHGHEVEFNNIEEGDPITRYYASDHFTLTVYPWNDDGFQSWAIVDASETVFASPLSKIVVYLELRCPKGSNFDVFMHLDAPVFWLDGTEIVATGDIDHIFYQDVIVTNNSLIVPVVVTRDWRWLKRVDAMEFLPNECGEDLAIFLVEARRINARETAQLELIQDDQGTRQFPKIAVEMAGELGLELREAAAHQYFERCRQAQNRIPDQRRKNLRVWTGQ